MDNKTFKQGMATLVKVFPDKDVDFDTTWEYLKDLKNDDFLKAINSIVMTCKDINRATNMIALIRDHAIPEDLSAGEAWLKVMKAISSIGSYGRPQFENELIDKSVASVGWRNLCMSENISVERAHFLKIYESIASRCRTHTLSLPKLNISKLIDSVISVSRGTLTI